jgi:hypothetical protein
LVEQSTEPALPISNRGYALETGFIVSSGAAQEFLEREKQGFARGIFREKHKTNIFFSWLYDY